MVWRGSHRVMQAALQAVIAENAICEVDVTEAYTTARRAVFEQCERVDLHVPPGGAMLLHRFVLHGTAPWDDRLGTSPPSGRMTAFFRPEIPANDWLWAT